MGFRLQPMADFRSRCDLKESLNCLEDVDARRFHSPALTDSVKLGTGRHIAVAFPFNHSGEL